MSITDGIRIQIINKLQLESDKVITIYNPYLPYTTKNTAMNNDRPFIVTMGRLEHQKGQWHLIRAFKYLLEKTNSNVDLVILGKDNLAYNDNNSFFSRMIKKQLYNFEKKCSYYVNRLLITSPKFFEEYYFNFYNKEQIIFVTNSPNESVFSSFFPHKGRFTVGFVGSIRYPNQMKMLIDISNDMDIDVLFAGGGVYEKALREYSKHNKNVFFIGQYDYDSQIASIYSRIDCLYVQYDTTIKNVRIALPNKLYEGAFCGIPIIVSHGVYLAEIVNKYKLGFDVIDGDKSDLIKKINDVRVLNKEELQHNCKVFYEANSFKTTIVKLLAAYEEMCNDS